MKKMSFIPAWTLAAPIAGWLILAGSLLGTGGWYALLMTFGLFASVLAAVHHAEVVAHRVGEPFGTLILALAVTVIEVALIVSLMLAGGASTGALARDTVFAAVMLILNGIVGLCLLVGGSRHREQSFGQHGVSASLATLAAIAVLTLVLPNFTTSLPGPVYNPSQLAFIAVISAAAGRLRGSEPKVISTPSERAPVICANCLSASASPAIRSVFMPWSRIWRRIRPDSV